MRKKKQKKEVYWTYKLLFYEGYDNELADKILNYCERTGVSIRALFLKALKEYLDKES